MYFVATRLWKEKVQMKFLENLTGRKPQRDGKAIPTPQAPTAAATESVDGSPALLVPLSGTSNHDFCTIGKLPKSSPARNFITDFVMTENIASQLASILPIGSRFEPSWTLGFTPALHGISIQTFYRQCGIFSCPSIVIMKDSKGNIFGGYAAEQWEPKSRYFGDTDCFVFRVVDGDVEDFEPSGKDALFLQADHAGFGMGEGPAWHVDASFLRGATNTSASYESPALADKDFVVAQLEVWFCSAPTSIQSRL